MIYPMLTPGAELAKLVIERLIKRFPAGKQAALRTAMNSSRLGRCASL
jgi:hypothetical protein